MIHSHTHSSHVYANTLTVCSAALMIAVGDGGATRNRLENLRFRLGWPEAGVDQYYGDGAQSGVVKRNGSPLDGLGLFDGLRGVKSSYGEDDEPDTITE